MRGGEERLGEYRYRWSPDCFPMSADSLALGAFCTLPKAGRVLDLGCGAGLLLLLCARRCPDSQLTGVELSPQAAELAQQNLADNGLSGEIFTADLRTFRLSPPADLVLSNPPWYPQNSGKVGSPGRIEDCPLPQLCQAAADNLSPKGRFALVHHPARLADLMVSLRAAGLEPKRLQFCRHGDKPPYALLLEAVKGGRPGLDILPDLTERRP